jgi:putative heme-binding domain-containing protein
LIPLLSDPDESLRVWAIRLLFDAYPLDTVEGKSRVENRSVPTSVLDELHLLAQRDPSPKVRLALACTLGRLPVKDRPALAKHLLNHGEDAGDQNIPKLVWYGLIPVALRQPDALVDLACSSRIPQVRVWISRCLAEQIQKQPGVVQQLLQQTSGLPESVRRDVVIGMAAGLAGIRQASKPEAWDTFKTGLPRETLEKEARSLELVFGSGRALDALRATANDAQADMASRRQALATLIEANPADLRQVCEKLLAVRSLNAVALEGLVRFDDPSLGRRITSQFTAFYPIDRPAVVGALATRPRLALALLEAVESGKIAKDLISPAVARQLATLATTTKDTALQAKLEAVWGTLRASPADKQAKIERLRQLATPEALAKADPKEGRKIFAKTCGTCHRLFGEGGDIGPDLTGSGRKDLDYLLTNLIDPGAVLAAEYRISVVELKDGRILSGMIRGKTGKTVLLQTDKEQLVLAESDIESTRITNQSLMPDGLVESLQDSQILDLIGYLKGDHAP